MTIYHWIIIACWAVFFLYWGVSAMSAKKTKGNPRYSVLVRVALILIILALFGRRFPDVVRLYHLFGPGIPTLAPLGAALGIVGIGLAVWARAYLGRNWGMPRAIKENPELVTTGPYAYIRHPIYTGMLVALIGTALAAGISWLAIFVVASGYFIYSSFQEEKRMLELFPDTYPAYKARTKMLIPFVF